MKAKEKRQAAGKKRDFEIEVLEVKEVEPVTQRGPRDGVAAEGMPERDDLKIVVSRPVLDAICDHVSSDMQREMGGLLVGTFCRDGHSHYVDVSDFIPAEHTESSGAHLKFTLETWDAADREMARRYPGQEKIIVGWYHSHPGLGVFVSSYDVEVHRQFHSWWQTALVVDPRSRNCGFFRVRDERLTQDKGFYVYEPGRDPVRPKLANAGTAERRRPAGGQMGGNGRPPIPQVFPAPRRERSPVTAALVPVLCCLGGAAAGFILAGFGILPVRIFISCRAPERAAEVKAAETPAAVVVARPGRPLRKPPARRTAVRKLSARGAGKRTAQGGWLSFIPGL